jgi:hypothetical protein
MIDRQQQLGMLREMAEHYPNRVKLNSMQGFGGPSFLVNLHYLYEYGLIDVPWSEGVSYGISAGNPRLTARGIDFLEDDGGLGAVLGVVTVRLHDDTIKALILDRIDSAEGDETTKQRLKNAIRDLPADGTKQVALRLMEQGLARAPDVLGWLQTHLSL